jgi:hypothetical protein
MFQAGIFSVVGFENTHPLGGRIRGTIPSFGKRPTIQVSDN